MASYTAAVDALTDVTAGQTLAEAGGDGHATVENRQNQAARELAAFLDGAESPVLSVNTQTGAVVLTASDVDAVPETAGFQYRSYNAGWPVRGTVPAGTIVMWIKRTAADPDPPVGGSYALDGVDIALLAQA